MTESWKWPVGRLLWNATGITIAALLALIWWLWTAQIGGATLMRGEVEVEDNSVAVQHLEGGPVKQINIREGEHVRAGQVILRLADEALLSEQRILQSQLDEILAQTARLEAERDELAAPHFPAALPAELVAGQTRLLHSRNQRLLYEIQQLDARKEQFFLQQQALTREREAFLKERALLEEAVAAQEQLDSRGLITRDRKLTLQQQLTALIGNIARIDGQFADLEGRSTEIDLQKLRLYGARQEEAITELRRLAPRRHELHQRLERISARLSELRIVAPISGTIHGLTVHNIGAVIEPARPIMTIVPDSRPLIVVAQLPVAKIGKMNLGQQARLLLPGTQPATGQDLSGTVRRISADSFTDEASRASFYRVEITLPKERRQALRMGMQVEVQVAQEPKKAIAYLIQPIASYFSRAFENG